MFHVEHGLPGDLDARCASFHRSITQVTLGHSLTGVPRGTRRSTPALEYTESGVWCKAVCRSSLRIGGSRLREDFMDENPRVP